MSKFATKAAANMFCQARYEAAKSNERLSSREGAAEEIGIDRTRLARIELGSTIPYQEEVLLMAFSVRCIISLALHVLQGHSHSRSSHTRLYSVLSWFLLEIHVRTFPVLLIPLLFSSASASSLTFNTKWLSKFID